MRGRYAYVSDGYALIREGISRLGVALAAAQIAAPRVLALPDRSSQIVAAAAARILGLPLEPFPEGGDEGPGLVVAYDLDRVGSGDALQQLREHHPGQVLFAHASCWTDPFPFAPDVTTYLYQQSVAPWDAGRMNVDPVTREVVQSEADEAPVDELAARVVDASGEDESVSTDEQLAAMVAAARRVTGEAARRVCSASYDSGSGSAQARRSRAAGSRSGARKVPRSTPASVHAADEPRLAGHGLAPLRGRGRPGSRGR